MEVVDGSCTPEPTPARDDEYLAWTLGGDLKKTLSVGPCWEKVPGMVNGNDEDAIEDIDQRLALLEQLDCKTLQCCLKYFLVSQLKTENYEMAGLLDLTKATNGRASPCFGCPICDANVGETFSLISPKKSILCHPTTNNNLDLALISCRYWQ